MSAIDDVLATGMTAFSFFGSNRRRARNKYMRYMRLVHPDINHDARAERATKVLNALWESYGHTATANASSSAPARHHARMVFRDDDMAVLFDDAKKVLLMVRRSAGVSLDVDADVGSAVNDMRDLADSSPVSFLPLGEHVSIAQKDGYHEAFSVPYDKSVDDVFALSALMADASHRGVLVGEDVAWMFKRVLFIAGVLDVVGVQADDGDRFLSRLMVMPKTHDMMVIDYSTMHRKDNASNVAVLARAFLKLVPDDTPHAGFLVKFITGCTVSVMPSAGELMNEYDDVLLDTFGAPRFHKMNI
jgi:hypothetical protein